MRFFLLLVLLPIAVLAGREKRFAALASGIGGAAGCVVTGNKLYANGIELRELSATEMQELNSYEKAMDEYKKTIKSAFEQRRDQLKKQLMSTTTEGQQSAVSDVDESINTPARPSFCNETTTTQYYFDGCMVQNNKVYVGKTYARDLTAEEQQQLAVFDQKMTVYQKEVQENIHKQMKGMFGGKDFFAALFGAEVKEESQSTTTSTTPSTHTQIKLEAPQAPKYCTAI